MYGGEETFPSVYRSHFGSRRRYLRVVVSFVTARHDGALPPEQLGAVPGNGRRRRRQYERWVGAKVLVKGRVCVVGRESGHYTLTCEDGVERIDYRDLRELEVARVTTKASSGPRQRRLRG